MCQAQQRQIKTPPRQDEVIQVRRAPPNQGHMAASAICEERPPSYTTATGPSPDAVSELPQLAALRGLTPSDHTDALRHGRPGSVRLEMKEWDTLLVARIAAGDDYTRSASLSTVLGAC